MRSRTKQSLDRERIERIVADAFGAGITVLKVRELTDGMFNGVWQLDLDVPGAPRGPVDDRTRPPDSVILKVAPPARLPLLTYEHRILRTEVLFLRSAAGLVPVPRVLHVGHDHPAVGTDVLLTSVLPGTAWSQMRDRLPQEENRRLRHDLGRLAARLHTLRGEFFGYPQPGAGLQRASWPETYLAMFETLLADADRFGVAFPLSHECLRDLVRSHVPALAEVTTACLVHADLWEGNVFVESGPDGPRITGIIDGERALWGDPAGELSTVMLGRGVDAGDPFLDGYREAGGDLGPEESLRLRVALYDLYLSMVIKVEAVPRGFTGPWHDSNQRFFAEIGEKALGILTG